MAEPNAIAEQAAIDILPQELLQKIFSACVGREPLTPKKDELPWILTQVCTSWRQTAIAHTALWSSITISVNNPRYPAVWVTAEGEEIRGMCNPPFDVVVCWLERSGTYPLSVTLFLGFTGWNNDFPSPIPRRILQLLHTHMSHMKTFSFQAPECATADANINHPFPPLIPGSNSLEDLHLKNYPEVVASLRPTDFPRLRSFTWTGDSTRALGLPVPWAQLTKAALCYRDMVHYIDCLKVLSETPNLLSFEASVIYNCGEDHCASRKRKLRLPQLTFLNINGTPHGLANLLQYLELPSLQDLTFNIYAPFFPEHSEMEELFPHLLKLFQTNESALRSLVVDNLFIPAHRFIQLLQCVSSSLVALDITGLPKLDNEVLSALVVPTSGEGVLCPRLSKLILNSCLLSPTGVLAEMVESRGSRHPLSRLGVTILAMQSSKYEEDLRRLKNLHSDGRLPFLEWVAWDDYNEDDW